VRVTRPGRKCVVFAIHSIEVSAQAARVETSVGVCDVLQRPAVSGSESYPVLVFGKGGVVGPAIDDSAC